MPSDTFYTYEPIPEADLKYKYCGAPRHGATHVQAHWIERYKAPDLGIMEEVQALSCNDCHDSMLLAFMEEMLPEATEEELREANETA